MAQVIWTTRAATQLQLITDYIARESEQNARLVAGRVVKEADRIGVFPGAGGVFAVTSRFEYRQFISKPFKIIYRQVSSERVLIVAVVHGAMNRPIADALDDDARKGSQ